MLVARLQRETGVHHSRLRKIIRTSSFLYCTYKIKKRTGGWRSINHPAPRLKVIQRWMARNIFTKLPVSDCVFSYRRGLSIRDLADLHKGSKYFLRIDFKDFFPSITKGDIVDLLEKHLDELRDIIDGKDDIELVADAVTRGGSLTIGAPSSPAISNAILYEFDLKATKLCSEVKAKYSRYADDIVISCCEPKRLHLLASAIKTIVAGTLSPSLRLNEAKTHHTSKKHHVRVTGLVLTSQNKVSVGRAKKREIKALVHRWLRDEIETEKMSYLLGYLAFIKSVEPRFLSSLAKKYGDDVIEKLLSQKAIQLKTVPFNKIKYKR